jgi:hypothetical protein
MSGPEVVVAFDSEGAAKVKQELGATDKQLQKIDKQLQRLQERAALEKLKGESVAYQKATEDLARAQGKLTAELSKQQKVFNAMGSFANKANEIGQFAGSVLGTAKALFEFAKAGAEAAAIADVFDQLGAAAPSMESLREATAGAVDDTTLKGFAKLASDLGLTAEEMEGLAQRATTLAANTGQLANTSEVLTQLMNGEAEGLRKLGVAIDLSDEAFKGLSETQKKLAIAQQLAAEGSQAQVDALEGTQVAMAKGQAAIDNLVSEAQTMFVEFLEGSGVLELLGTILEASMRQMKAMAPALDLVAGAFKVAWMAGAPLRGLLELLAITIAEAIGMLEKVALVLGASDGKSLKSVAGKATEKLRGLEEQHYAAADAALEQARAVGVLNSQLGESALSFKEIGDLAKFSEMENGARLLADTLLDAGGTFKGAADELAVLEKRLEDQKEASDASQEATELSDAVFDELATTLARAGEELAAMEVAQKKATAATRSQAAANVEFIGVLQTMIAQFGVLADATITDAAAQAETMIARQALLDLVNSGQQALNETARQTFELGAALAEQTVLDIENLQRKNELIAEANELQAAQVDGMGALAKAGSLMAVSIGGQTDKWGALNSAIVGSAAAFKQAGTAQEKIGATLSAGKAITASVVDDTTTQAAILGAFEVAEAAANFANPPAAVAHGLAAALYFGVAAKGGKGGGGGGASAGAGTASAAAAQTPTTQIIEEPTLPSQSFGVTNFFNVESTNPDTAGDNILSALNAFTESGSGALLSPDLIGESQGRSGL